jgi:hypothetical protein
MTCLDEGKMPDYAVFTMQVEDVEAACRRADEAGALATIHGTDGVLPA